MELLLPPADNRCALPNDLAPLLDRIRLLADRLPDGSPDRLLEELEHTLTDGYALALSLEGESMRIEKEIGATLAAANGTAEETERLDALTTRLAATNREVGALRAHLASLRIRTESVRAAALAR
jgi:hypothetical protein